MPLITRPNGLTFTDWASQLVQELERYGSIEIPFSEDNWRSWADHLLWIPKLSEANIPDNTPFATWQEWAEKVVEALDSLPN